MKNVVKLIVFVHVSLFRLSQGRLGSRMLGGHVLLLTTTGNKSGKERTVPVMQIDDEGKRYVVASMGGQPEHPAWYKNLVKNPVVTVEIAGGERYQARAETLSSEARRPIWGRLIVKHPNFAEYQTKTAREIPVVELKRL